jgi:periplasmic copper chaperone A
MRFQWRCIAVRAEKCGPEALLMRRLAALKRLLQGCKTRQFSALIQERRMRHAARTVFVLSVLAVALLSAPANSQDYSKGSLNVERPWTRATPQGATVAAGYLVIENRGAAVDRLISVSVPVDVAGRAEIHEMAVQDGVMKMRPLPRGIEIAPGFTVKLEPGGLHLMFLDLKRPLAKGDRFKGTLKFERAGDVEVEFVAEAMGAPRHMGH